MYYSNLRVQNSFKEIHHVTNDSCPICGEKFEYIFPICVLQDKAYCFNCVEKLNINFLKQS